MPFVSSEYMQHISAEKRDRLLRTYIRFGYHPETGDALLIPDTDRYAGSYICGIQGVGKSAFIENLIWADHKAGNAVIVIDPHGDLTVNCLAALPPHRIPHTYLLDMNDEAFPFGINVFTAGTFKTSLEQSQAVDRIMHIFDVLWPDVLSQQALPRYMRAAIITLLANPGSTLVDMYRLLLDDTFRAGLLRQVQDESVTQFWQTQFSEVPPAERLRRVQPLIGRLESLFMGRSLVRNIVGQRQTTINFRQAIENHEVIFIHLPVKTVEQDARLIGTMIVSQIHAAIFSFADVPEKQRPGVSLYIDEFQEFSTYDINELFTQGRKYGIKLTVAHQYRNQLPKYLQGATMTARTKVCFQTTPDDSREMGHAFPVQASEVRAEDIEPKPVEYLLKYGSPDSHVQTFIDFYVRPMTATKHGSRVDIEGGQMTYSLWHGASLSQIFVGDPTPYLNHLLYDVMRTGSPDLPLSFDALAGFANCGHKFYTQVRFISDNKLSAAIQFPRHLVAPVGDGFRWLRPPETPNEQLLHLLFHVRMTMRYLSEHPIGDASAPNAAEVGRMLSQLPRRAAFVRSGETTGVIYTDDTPERLTGSVLQTRTRGILQQSRDKYAHPRDDVEAARRQPNTPPASAQPNASVPPSVSRWEEI